MKNTALKKTKENLEYERRLKEGFHEELIAAKAKLERYEQVEEKADAMMLAEKEDLQGQVIWLRNLVEKLAIKPEVFGMIGKQERRRDEMHWRFEEQRRKRDERVYASAAKEPRPTFRKGMF